MREWYSIADISHVYFLVEGLAGAKFPAGCRVEVKGTRGRTKYRIANVVENSQENVTYLWTVEYIGILEGDYLRRALNVGPEQIQRRRADGRFQALGKGTK